jgi:ABC-2 type transport system permease protein
MRKLEINLYFSLLRMKIVNTLAYRASAWSQILGVVFYGFIQTSIMLAFYLYGDTSSIAMIQSQAISHMWMVVIFFGLMPLGANSNVYSKISSGLVAYDLCKPIDLYWFWYSTSVSDSVIKFWVRAPLTALLAFLLPLPYRLMLPVSLPAFLVFVLSIILAILLSGTITMLLTLTFINTEMGRGLGTLLVSIIILLSGDLFPLPILPNCIVGILRALPFAGLKDIPVSIYLGLIPLNEAIKYMSIQVIWIVLLILLGRFILGRYTKSIVIQGG